PPIADRDLRRAEALDRQLAVAGGSLLSPFRQAPCEESDRGRHSVQTGPASPLQAAPLGRDPSQYAGLVGPAERGDFAHLSGEATGTEALHVHGHNGLQLSKRLPGPFARRL